MHTTRPCLIYKSLFLAAEGDSGPWVGLRGNVSFVIEKSPQLVVGFLT